jgi:anti-sigma-K factor RskA
MIDEEKQDQLIAHLLGSVEPATGRELEAEISGDAELASLADELRESIGALAHAAPLQAPPPHLRPRVLAVARGESAAPAFIKPSEPRKPTHGTSWLSWAIAAGLAVAAVIQFGRSERFRREAAALRGGGPEAIASGPPGERFPGEAATLRVEAESARREAAALRDRNIALEAENRVLDSQTGALRQELANARKRDTLAEVRIATLTAQVTALTRASAVIVWDAEQQRGILRLANLPKADSGKDYQLWVIDPKYPTPVSAGVISVGTGGSAYVSFSPTKPIAEANKFAISVERAGGAPAPAGPIVFVGD